MYIVNTVKSVILYENAFRHLSSRIANAQVANVLLHDISHNYKISYIAFLQGVN